MVIDRWLSVCGDGAGGGLGPLIAVDVEVIEVAALPAAPTQGPTRLKLKTQELVAITARLANLEFRTSTWSRGYSKQEVVGATAADAEAIDRGEVAATDTQGIAIGIDVALTDVGEVKGHK
jgi:hypothetical protein